MTSATLQAILLAVCCCTTDALRAHTSTEQPRTGPLARRPRLSESLAAESATHDMAKADQRWSNGRVSAEGTSRPLESLVALLLALNSAAAFDLGRALPLPPRPELRSKLACTGIRCNIALVDMASASAADMVCTPGTHAGLIEKAVCRVFGAEGTRRVRLSVKRLADGDKLHRRLDDAHELMVQEANSYIEDLTPQPWHDASKFAWTKKLEEKWTIVRDELKAALEDEGALLSQGQNVWGGLDESIVEYGTGWKTLPLCDRTVWDPVNSALFPQTCALIHKCKVPLVEAFFAKMVPKSDIKPHSDMCNFVLTSHLGLIIPEGECELTVGNKTEEWRNGRVTLFDTSIHHSAVNRADTTRYILMFRVYHPEVTELERSALQLVFDCLDEPELLDDFQSLSEYQQRRREVEAQSRTAWEDLAKRKNKLQRKQEKRRSRGR